MRLRQRAVISVLISMRFCCQMLLSRSRMKLISDQGFSALPASGIGG